MLMVALGDRRPAPVRAAREGSATRRVGVLRTAAHCTRSRWRLPERVRGPLARTLHDADVRTDPETAIVLWLAGALAIAAIASSVVPGMAIPAGLTTLVAGPVSLRVGRTRRERRFAAALPGTIEQVAAELRGGGTVAGAVDRLASSEGPVADDLRRVHVRTRLGLGLSDALVGMAG